MLAGQRQECLANRRLIQRNRNVPVGVAPERAGVPGIPDPVGIGFAGGQKTGMEICRHLPAILYPDIRRKHSIQHKGIFIRGNRTVCIKMNLLIQCVNTGIRTGRTGHGNRMTAGRRKRLLQYLLDSQTVDLALPAGISGAVIFHCQQDPFQRKIPSSMISARSAAIAPQAIQSFRVSFRTRRRVRPSPP